MICLNCGKLHDASYGSGRFCSKECAKSYSAKQDNKQEMKLVKCITCGTPIFINKRASSKKCKCELCKTNVNTYNTKLTRVKICAICGSPYLLSNGGCHNTFCHKHGIAQFKTLIKYFGFDSSKLGTSDVEVEFNRVRCMLYDLYWKNNMSGLLIAELFNYNNKHNITLQIFKYLDIPTRTSFKDITTNTWLLGRINLSHTGCNIYKAGIHKTWNNKYVYLRSSYEFDYAIYLDEIKEDYEVEYIRIKYFDSLLNIYRCAIPDFYLLNTNTIVEVKSNWTLNVLNMKDKFIAYRLLGYNTVLVLEHKEVDINTL